MFPLKWGGVVDVSYPGSKTRRGRVEKLGYMSPTICAEMPPSRIEKGKDMGTKYAIRKLTPRECGRLMDFKDEDITKMLEVNSQTQVYKECGNSIVVSVLYHIFKGMME